MECPNCKHATNDTALLQCSHCGEAFERGPLEEFQHLAYLTQWLNDRSEISALQRKDLLSIVEKKQAKLLQQLTPKETPVEKPVIAEKATLPQAEPVTTPEPTPAPEPVLTSAPASEIKPIVAPAPKPVAPPIPIAPPKPKKPPVDWKKVREQLADAATSGALLRALLYLGAFMIVISATVLVIRFWNQFNQILQLIFIASVPLMFYSGGWMLRTRLKLEQGGTVLTGIGAILVAVDFAAIYQFGGIAERVHGPTYWLGVSLFCTLLYTFTATRIKGEFFNYLTLISGACIVVALTRIPANPPDLAWTVVSVTFSSAVMIVLAGRFWDNKSKAWHDFARSAKYLPQILIPASLFYILFSRQNTPIMSAFLLATIGYTVLAWKFPSVVFAYSALIASIGAVIFGLRGAKVDPNWYALAATILAFIYITVGLLLKRSKSGSKVTENYIKALNSTGLTLIGLGAVSGFFIAFAETWAGVLAMLVATLDLVICAVAFKHSRYTLMAAGLFLAPFTFALWQWFADAELAQSLGWSTVAWSGLSLTYMLLGGALYKHERHAKWLHLIAHGLVLFAIGILPFEYLALLKEWSYIPASTTLGLALVLYITSAVLHNTDKHPALSQWFNWIPFGVGKSIFIWFAGLLFPVWMSLGWYGNDLNSLWFGATLTIFGISYIGIGQLLKKQADEYRLPLHVYSYILFAIGILIAIPDPYSSANWDRYPLLLALIVSFISLASLAYIYNRVAETSLASVLFIWLFTLSIGLTKVTQQAHGLAFILLAGIIYLPVGIWLQRQQKSHQQHHPIPVFVTGYLLSLYAIFNSIYWSVNNTTLPWVSPLVALIATTIYIFSVWHFKEDKEISSIFSWASMITFAIAFRQSLTFFQSPPHYDAFAWIVFAAFYMIVERVLNSMFKGDAADKNSWLGNFQLPLTSGLVALSSLGLYLTIPNTLTAFSGIKLTTYLPFIVAQSALVILTIAAALLYRTRIPLFIEPAIAFLAATLFFVGYGESLFGTSLTTPQYALAWTGLGIIHILAAIFTDKAKERYAHGLYLGGYIILSWAVLWSMIDRATLTWSFGLWILASVTSALLIHFRKHQTWDDLLSIIFGETQNGIRTFARNIFQWLAAWTFPIWCVILLNQLNVHDGFQWLGLIVPPLAYLGLALWTRRIDPAYVSPLFSAAQKSGET